MTDPDRGQKNHFTLPEPGDLEKLQRGRTAGRSALQMSHRTNPPFNLSTLSCRGGHFSAASLPLFVFPLFHRDRGTERLNRGQRCLHKPHFTNRKILASGFVLHGYSQQGDFSPHVTITCLSQKIKGVCGTVILEDHKRVFAFYIVITPTVCVE